MKKATFFAGPTMLAFCAFVVAQTAQQTAPKVMVGTQLNAKAATPAPGANAKNTTQKASVGKGATSVKASQPSSFWTEELDVDDDGTVENSQYLYDAKRGILYTYREDDFACPNGNPESGSILMALYANGNPANKPVGSGWYLVNLMPDSAQPKRQALSAASLTQTAMRPNVEPPRLTMQRAKSTSSWQNDNPGLADQYLQDHRISL